jgi:hypothetical protein
VKSKSKIHCGVACGLSDVQGFWLSQVGVVGQGGASWGDCHRPPRLYSSELSSPQPDCGSSP